MWDAIALRLAAELLLGTPLVLLLEYIVLAAVRT
jgi:hypothetical protein